MTITLYGIASSRAVRCMWMLEELGIPYEHVKTDYRAGDTRTSDYLKINPNGHIPTMQDGDLTLFESMAINLYLAMKYAKDMWPASVEDQARAIQWSFWGMTELEPQLLQVLAHRVALPEDRRDDARANAAWSKLRAPLMVLEAALGGRDFLLGNAFSVADLNVASILSWARVAKATMEPFPQVDHWLTACLERPAFRTALKK